MLRYVMLVVLSAIFVMTIDDSPAVTVAPPSMTLATAPERSSESVILAQARRKARPQIRVSPRYPYRRFHTTFPVPYTYEYPGPNGVRHCVNRYVTEHRPSGTVIVPRMNCVWVVRR